MIFPFWVLDSQCNWSFFNYVLNIFGVLDVTASYWRCGGLLWTSVKTLIPISVSVLVVWPCGRLASALVCTDPPSPPDSPPLQTAKDDTAYTQVSDKPDEPSETPATQPMKNGSYIAMSPVEPQKCWWRIAWPSVELREGAEGAARGWCINHGWGSHTVSSSHIFLGVCVCVGGG